MKRLNPRLLAPAVLVAAAVLCLLAALLAVGQIEARTGAAVRDALARKGMDWAQVRPDGMLMHLSGTAPDEAARFRAVTAAGEVIDSAHVMDETEVVPPNPLAAPRFSVELLRNDAGISVIGLIPGSTDREALARTLARTAGRQSVTDMLESANHAAPEGWDTALAFGLEALGRLQRAKISITANRVAVTAISDSAREKARLERDLGAAVPKGLTLVLDISAPRPVIAPFTLRFVKDAGGARFDACAADTEEAAARIVEAARAAGLAGEADCPLGLGVPAPNWGSAVARGIAALAEIGAGTLTFSDADVTLVAPAGTEAARFEKATRALEADLPEPFKLGATLLESAGAETATGTPAPAREFVAILTAEGQVQLRGLVPDPLVQAATESYARARFGQGSVQSGMRIDPALPEGWPLRVLAGLEALSQLTNGSVVVQAGVVRVRGLTTDDGAQARVARLLADRLGEAQTFEIDITYREPTETPDGRPTPEVCVARIGEILAQQKITFAPGKTTVEGAAAEVVDRIADVLRECPGAPIEIGGHTDSQGREEMNESLSQKRADAVLTALMGRRILTSNLTARGYGESRPIADNETEEGREANRRIEFRLIGPDDGAGGQDAPQDAPQDGQAQQEPEGEDDGQD